jgi:hypothetical protein
MYLLEQHKSHLPFCIACSAYTSRANTHKRAGETPSPQAFIINISPCPDRKMDKGEYYYGRDSEEDSYQPPSYGSRRKIARGYNGDYARIDIEASGGSTGRRSTQRPYPHHEGPLPQGLGSDRRRSSAQQTAPSGDMDYVYRRPDLGSSPRSSAQNRNPTFQGGTGPDGVRLGSRPAGSPPRNLTRDRRVGTGNHGRALNGRPDEALLSLPDIDRLSLGSSSTRLGHIQRGDSDARSGSKRNRQNESGWDLARR